MDLPKNVGDKDRNIRFAVGIALVVFAYLAGKGNVGFFLSILGLVAIGTGYTRTCLAYKMFGIDTTGK